MNMWSTNLISVVVGAVAGVRYMFYMFPLIFRYTLRKTELCAEPIRSEVLLEVHSLSDAYKTK